MQVKAERARQLTEKGWTPEHDDEHTLGELAAAAACYAAPFTPYQKIILNAGEGYVDAWPWFSDKGQLTKDIKKYKNRRRQLLIAAALIVAEIERMDRETAHESE